MKQFNMKISNLKELEKILFRTLHETYKQILVQILEKWDQEISEQREKKQFELKDMRRATLDTTFGTIEFKRNYYFDRSAKKYVYLLDQALQFDGSKGFSPLIEEWGLELATTGSSYRQAVHTLEQFLGYSVMSHEALRQHLLQTSVLPSEQKHTKQRVLFVEVDGLYVKSQEKKTKGFELKFASVHEGWQVNGKRVKLRHKRHFLAKGHESFWEEFENFLHENYEYDPTHTLLVINGDGSRWITACQEHFRHNSFFTLDRFHVARWLKQVLKGHPRYRSIRLAFKQYRIQKLFLELNSAVGTMETDEKEEELVKLIAFLERHKKALGDYRDWLKEKGIPTEQYRPMGSAESMMSQLATRLKNGRAWSKKGAMALASLWIGLKDDLSIRTLFGKWRKGPEQVSTQKANVRQKKAIPRQLVNEAVRGNIPYLKQAIGKPITQSLQILRGF